MPVFVLILRTFLRQFYAHLCVNSMHIFLCIFTAIIYRVLKIAPAAARQPDLKLFTGYGMMEHREF